LNVKYFDDLDFEDLFLVGFGTGWLDVGSLSGEVERLQFAYLGLS
jgi:hypothetical protein